MIENIFWLGHSTVKIKGEKTVYFDPWKLAKEDQADIILISHSHYDHCSAEDVKKIRHDKTVIFTSADCAAQFSGDVRVLAPGETVREGGIIIEAVPSYNLDKAFHPRANNWLGFIVTIGGKRIYYAGDTDYVPEMQNIKADIVIIPVGGKYTMTAAEAARAVGVIGPEAAIPIHYGDIVGSLKDAEEFERSAGVPVIILPVSNG
ncbi:MAG: MBL fold metallo-hydrolase [Smithellaceae bacterium]|nr:MBL fold metallo-hydrolase [Smithellaceae bacterium]